MDIKATIEKKRLYKDEKEHLVRQIIKVAIKLLNDHGTFIKIGNIDGRLLTVKKGNLETMYTTPFNKFEGVDYLLDVWLKGTGKVLSLRWAGYTDYPSNPNDIDIVGFKRGDWINTLLC